jgi:hypothetical protein
MPMENMSMEAVLRKLDQLGGAGPLKLKMRNVRSRLRWRDVTDNTIRHLLYREQKPSLEQVRQIEAAHLKHCAEKVRHLNDEVKQLYAGMREAIAAMEADDAEYHRETLAEVRHALFQARSRGGQAGDAD